MKLRGNAEAVPIHPGFAGKGKAGRVKDVNLRGCLVRISLGWMEIVTEVEGLAAEKRQRRSGMNRRPWEHRWPRGIGGAQSGRVSCKWNVETPSRSRRGDSSGRPTARRAESRGGNRMPKKRRPVAERQQERETGDRSLRRSSRITGRIPVLVAGHESALTCGRWAFEDELVKALELKGKLDTSW
ncbi:hypothetical protein [Amycolatopsis samaneae]|uniref:Uncharacterized protein n=1 Tax=Amycolatopsis samaneae TaxID=664691 RepID=A0ABW5GKD7_9PSEU